MTRARRLLFAVWLIGAASSAWADAGAVSPLAFDTARLAVEGNGRRVAYTVELARTDAERQQGLMGRRTLAADAGMLFDFGVAQPVAMWMRNTFVPLDMLFADDAGGVVEVIENTTPLSEALLMPRVPVRYVLELRAGQVARHGFAVGDRLRLPGAVRAAP